jgi:monoterpene epsilon-lactone hydrolase
MTEDGGRLLVFPRAPDAIELRHLRAFVAVAEELNFGRAAAQLYVSQPALSRQIRALEQLVGCELLRRSTHRVELTLAGDALLERARRVLRDVDEAVTAVQAVGGELAERAARLWAPIADVWGPNGDLQRARAAYEELLASFSPPEGVRVRSANADGVPALVVTPAGDAAVTVMHLHGGGYVLGSAFGYQALAGALANTAGAGVLVPEYRLAPEHPYPAAADDALRAYRWLIARTPAAQVTLTGDSAGCGLVMSLLLRLKQEGLPLPGGAVLLCPWLDLTGASMERQTNREPAAVQWLAQARGNAAAYLGDHPLDDPLVSPLTADLAGLPPLLIQGGTADLVIEDAHGLQDRARAHGVDSRLELYPVETHVFHIFWAFLPEAADALAQAGEFIRGVYGPRVDRPAVEFAR